MEAVPIPVPVSVAVSAVSSFSVLVAVPPLAVPVVVAGRVVSLAVTLCRRANGVCEYGAAARVWFG